MKKLVAVMLSAVVGAALAQDGRQSLEAPVSPLAADAASDAVWSVWGGEVWFQWNRDLVGDLGMQLSTPKQMLGERVGGMQRFALREATGLDFSVKHGNFDGFREGSVAMRGGYDLRIGDRTVSLQDLRLAVRKDQPFKLDVVSSDGTAWFYIDRLMYALEKEGNTLRVQAMDLRVSPALAAAIGQPDSEGLVVAGMRMHSNVIRGGFASTSKGSCFPQSSKWPGMPTPGGGIYEADVFMDGFTMQYSRKDNQANGPGGTDGLVVYTPSSTLRNNVNNGTAQPTFPNDPLGTSTALHAADVAWREKFTTPCEPYDSDQHPYLIWNLYRIDALGRIEQVGRSGVKHAFLTTNVGCSENPGTGHILGRGCRDTYGTGNNDSGSDLGPRNEILPASGLWGRCGSIYDGNCNGNDEDFGGYSNFDHRMKVRESKIDPNEPENAGATYRFESWYIVRDDINIYNTMQTRPATFSWSGSTWSVSNGNPSPLGSAIDQWVPAGTTAPNQRNTEVVDTRGRAKVAVKVTDVGGGRYRYDYAVMNFDFAHAVTEGREPNLRVLSNDGFVSFSVPASAALEIDDIEFSDGDTDLANDWTRVEEPNRLTWSAPAGNRLNWGTLFSFSFTANAAPVEAPTRLTTAQLVPVDTLDALSLVPQSTAVVTYGVGGELSGLAAGQSVTLRLNSGAPLTLDADGVFVFPNEIMDGGSYTATVVTQPTTQTCTIANDTGTIDGADVTDIAVTCTDNPPPTYSIGGSVAGLGAGRSLTLQLNGEDTLTPVADGPFSFNLQLEEGDTYAVVVSDVPEDRNCTLSRGSGTVGSSNVTNIAVACTATTGYAIGGSITGLTGTLRLQLNDGEILQRTANGAFTFATRLNTGDAYDVTVSEQPVGQRCLVSGGEGLVGSSSIGDVAVECTTLTPHTVGGSLTGLPSGRSIALRLNGGPALVLSSSRSFTFSQTVYDGDAYTVTIASSPSGLECSVLNGTGTIAGGNVGDVRVSCREPGQSVPFADGFE